jgi:hypothetical protein
MALVLLLLIAAYFGGGPGWLTAAIVVQVVVMTAPRLFRPWAVAWFALSHALGFVMSKVLLGIVFLLLVTPLGLVRRAMGKDALRLRQFKAGRGSVMVTRNHPFTAADLKQPY